MTSLRAAVLGVVFVLELVAVACVARWGWWAGGGRLAGAALAVGAVLVWTAVWGCFLSPRARVPLPGGAAVVVRAAMVAIAAVGGGLAGWTLVAAVLVVGWLTGAAAEAAL